MGVDARILGCTFSSMLLFGGVSWSNPGFGFVPTDEVALQGPVFTQEPTNLVFPLDSEDRTLRLVCEVQGHPKPVTRWRVNGTLLDEAQDYRYRVQDRDLIVTSPDRVRDVGTFQCEATNSVGTILSREAVLQFACES
ncbi:hypothetical protein GDO81_024710 [Engystomops pustulosus]|uniref:Ig-like domain-containing protein n=1 Tax=Engystomops pustulosus TaxID=76066 RepID=A0AAV6Z7T7_ENGPU|nr:hypothetical protein GDO81_024710 [Engystomops pustulosus]